MKLRAQRTPWSTPRTHRNDRNPFLPRSTSSRSHAHHPSTCRSAARAGARVSAAKRLASLLSADPRPTVEVLVAGQRFTARVREATGFINATLIEVVIADVSASAPALVTDEQLPLMPSEIVRRLFEEARREGLPAREEPRPKPQACALGREGRGGL